MKNKFKFITILITTLIMISTFSFAEQAQTPIEPRTSDVEEINITQEEATTTNLESDAINTNIESGSTEKEPDIYKGDLYIFEDNVIMDKLVDGNVYIIGKNVNITGQIAGNLFVVADKLTIGDNTSSSSYNGYVFYNIYALANKAILYSSCYDLYISGKDITIEDSFYLYRDLKIGAKTANIYANIGRNVDAKAKNLNIKKDDSSYATIYGNLNYFSNNEISNEITSQCVLGKINYSKDTSNSNLPSIIQKTLIVSFVFSLLILTLVLTIIFKLVLSIIRKFQNGKTSKKEVKKIEETRTEKIEVEEESKIEKQTEETKVQEEAKTEEEKDSE